MSRRSNKPYERTQARARASDDRWVHDKAPDVVPRSVVNAGRAGAGAGGGPPNSRLVVSNLHYEILPKDLISIFGQISTLVREPDIKYDRSGRSTGIAFVQYESPAEATRARNMFNKMLAKGQPMEISFDRSRPAKQAANDPTSLVNRISKPPLLERLTSDVPARNVSKKAAKPEAPKAQTGSGPVRTRGGRRRGGAGAKAERVRKEPKTAEDLDKELEAYLGDDLAPNSAVSAPAPAGADEDVDMAA